MISDYKLKRRWKFGLLLAAACIAVFTMVYTNFLVKKLSLEEKKKMQQWADANKLLTGNADLSSETINYLFNIIRDNKTIPVILTDEKGNINSAVNIDSLRIKDTLYLRRQIEVMKSENEPITFRYDAEDSTKTNTLYFRESTLLRQLRFYPFIQLSIISLFLLVSYLAFSASRKSEQNKVWLGMSKETAHQLGTPISSLMAWMEFVKSNNYQMDEEVASEMDKDLRRLGLVTERFSKIGSSPMLSLEDLKPVIENAFDYMRKRSSHKVTFNVTSADQVTFLCEINVPLFEWVIENLCKNAIDAMNGEGRIDCHLERNPKGIIIDLSDTGKGLSKNQFQTIFKPGYTTKKRGWGMGLSLVKRIVEDYHSGEIFVKSSEPNKGTTFRIILKAHPQVAPLT